MKSERYIEIKKFLGELIKGTEWEGHVYAVGGCVRDELMGSEIKDIDLCVSLPSGGVRFAEWLRDNGHTHTQRCDCLSNLWHSNASLESVS